MIDLLLTQLQLKLPNHTYRAVERVLAERERSEGAVNG